VTLSHHTDTADAERLASEAPILTRWAYRKARWRFRLNSSARADLYTWLSILLKRGQRVDHALATLYHIETSGGERAAASPIGRVIPTWIADMRFNGVPLSRLMEGWLPPSEYLVFAALSRTGLAPDALAYLAHTTKVSADVMRTLFAMGMQVYFTVIGVVGLGFVFSSMVPELLMGVNPRLYTANVVALLAMSDFFATYGVLIVVGLAALPGLFVWTTHSLTGRVRDRLDGWMLFRQYRDVQGAILLRAIASLLSANRGFFEALDALHESAPPYLRYHIDEIRRFRSFRPYAAMRATGLEFPSTAAITTIGVVMETTKAPQEIQRFADEWQAHTARAVESGARRLMVIYQGIIYALGLWLILAFNDVFSLTEKIQ
jgi:type II secretory pathway component PulF